MTNQQREGWVEGLDSKMKTFLIKLYVKDFAEKYGKSNVSSLRKEFQESYIDLKTFIKETLATERGKVLREVERGIKNVLPVLEESSQAEMMHNEAREDVLSRITSLKEKEHTHDWKYIIHDDPIQALTGNYYQCRCGEKKYSL